MIDIGLNLTNRQFVHDQEELLYRAEEAGVTQMILTGTSLRSSKESFALAKGYPALLYSTAGVHPHDAKTMNEQTIPELSTLLKEKQVVAVGECGLDFDRDFPHALYKSSVFVRSSPLLKRCKSHCSYTSVLPLTDL